jgi:hypothetical protein
MNPTIKSLNHFLTAKVRNALEKEGYQILGALEAVEAARLMSIQSINAEGVCRIDYCLRRHGFSGLNGISAIKPLQPQT